jgi:HPt (histidine-containing phosphotransfer) domain-containing protein
MLQNLRDITDHDPAMLSELIDVFLERASPRLAAIRDAIDQEDAEALERTAHVLKSSSAQMGVVPLAQLCADLEALGRSGTTTGASDLIESLTSTYQQARVALKSEASHALSQGLGVR